jgi:Ca2+-binding RTX toxin-like protein
MALPTGPYAYWSSTAGAASFVSSTEVPDGRGAAAGTGFTNTGLARAPDGTWWLANHGQANSTDSSYTPSLVHLSADLSTKLGEIPLGDGARSLQGLAYNTKTNQLLVASLSEHTVRVVNLNGTTAATLAVGDQISPNALAYDPTSDAVIVGHSPNSLNPTVVDWRSLSTGAVLKSLTLAANPDHGFLDPNQGVQGTFYYTYGDSGRPGKVVVVDVASGIELGRYELPQADAIEGIYVSGGTMWVNNDAYYHNGADPVNAVLKFSFTPPAVVVDHRASSKADDIDLAVHDQVSNGARLVGVPRLFFEGGSAADTVAGGACDDVFVGNGGGDVLTGGGGADYLVGLADDDTLTGGAGKDRIDGGAGTDTAVFSGKRSDYAISQVGTTGAQVVDRRSGSPEGTDQLTSIEKFKFSDAVYSYADLFGSSPASPTLSLSGGSVLEMSAAGVVAGTLSATDPNGATSFTYTLVNSAGGRFVLDGSKLEVASGAVLDHEASASQQVVIRVAAAGQTLLEKTFNIAVADVNEAPTKIALSNLAPFAGGASTRTLVANLNVTDPDTDPAFSSYAFKVDDSRFEILNGDLYLKANQAIASSVTAIAVKITVQDGAFTLTKGFDLAVAPQSGGGGGGTPSGTPTSGADIVNGGDGADSIDGLAGSDRIGGGGGNDKLTGGSGFDTLSGGEGDDRFILKRGTGYDAVDGGPGTDKLIADFEKLESGFVLDVSNPATAQRLTDGTTIVGVEVLEVTASPYNDKIIGGRSGDVLNGLGGRDMLAGGDGVDILNGGVGDDTLTGGAGADRYMFDARGWGVDTITDFQHGVDDLDLRGLGLSWSKLKISHSGATTTIAVPDFGSIVLKNDTGFNSSDILF